MNLEFIVNVLFVVSSFMFVIGLIGYMSLKVKTFKNKAATFLSGLFGKG